MYKLNIIYKNNSETMTLNFQEDQSAFAKDLFNTLKDELIKLREGSINCSVIDCNLAFVIDVNEIASAFLNEVEDD